MKILFVLPEFGDLVQGGIARFYEHLIAGLRDAGHDVTVCIAQETAQAGVLDGVNIRVVTRDQVELCHPKFEHFRLTPGLKDQLARAAAAYNVCDAGRGFDIVETTDWGLLYVPWLMSARRHVPVVVQLHGSAGQIRYHDPLEGEELSSLLTRMIETALLPRADELQTYGSINAEEWRTLLGRPVEHIYPAWRPSNRTAEGSLGTFGLVASRLQVWKGPDVLCSAFENHDAGTTKVLWAGRDQPHGSLECKVSEGLAARFRKSWNRVVVPIGGQPPAKVADLLSEARFYVHPSHWEVFGLAVVEAMQASKLVVCSVESGAAGLIVDGVNGFLFSSSRPEELAAILRRIQRLSDDEIAEFGRKARDTIVTVLDPKLITQQRTERFRGLTAQGDLGSHPWLETLFAPKAVGRPDSVLDAFPARRLFAHLAKRILRRVRSEITPPRQVGEAKLIDSAANEGALSVTRREA